MDEPGGTRHLEMAQILSRQGHQVTVIASSVSYLTGAIKGKKNAWCTKEVPYPGVTVLRTYTYAALHRSFFHRLMSYFSFTISSFIAGLGVKHVEVVWGTSPPIFQAFSAWLLARLKGARFLFEVRDLWPAFAIAVGVLRNSFLIFLSEWLEKFLYSHADKVVVNSPGFIDFVKKRGARSVELVPNGVDPEMFLTNGMGDFRIRYNLKEKFIVLYAGAHGISNDLEVVIKAAEILKDHPDIHFLLVGGGKEKQNLIKIAQDKGLQNITFLPAVPKADMKEILSASDACVAILKPLEMYRTTYPNKVFDYMAASKPVLLAIDGVIRTVIEDAHAGMFVPPGNPSSLADAVLYLKNHPEISFEMGLLGRKYVSAHFNRSYWTKVFLNILEGLVKYD